MGKQVFRPNPETDPFHPPAIPTEVHCLHCNKEYESYLIHWEERVEDDGIRRGFWCCATHGCEGKGFGFDIFPTDPDYIDENGERMFDYDEDDARRGDLLDAEPAESPADDDMSQYGLPLETPLLLYPDDLPKRPHHFDDQMFSDEVGDLPW